MKKLDTLLTKQLDALAERVADRVLSRLLPLFTKEQKQMAKIDDELATLGQEVSAMSDTVQSATAVIDGIGDKVRAAVDAALAAGATEAQLQAITDVTTALDNQKAALSAAVASQTP